MAVGSAVVPWRRKSAPADRLGRGPGVGRAGPGGHSGPPAPLPRPRLGRPRLSRCRAGRSAATPARRRGGPAERPGRS
ncbi:hypothetical protein AF335_30830 [Streptomyces eurocidicus]|uniref:Uncharacterized protein n=1 Tax=Streptomyces eurocidicus TaxID=66423 RepID=A0A2N8NN19_STREU|nr:hypothetical protein AF335_30830 [Streptomyces eurocidicus]